MTWKGCERDERGRLIRPEPEQNQNFSPMSMMSSSFDTDSALRRGEEMKHPMRVENEARFPLQDLSIALDRRI